MCGDVFDFIGDCPVVSSSWLDGVLKMINNQLQVYFDFNLIYLEHELSELKKKKQDSHL